MWIFETLVFYRIQQKPSCSFLALRSKQQSEKNVYYSALLVKQLCQMNAAVKKKILSPFTYPHVIPYLDDFLSSAGHQRRHCDECGKPNNSGAPLTTTDSCFPTMVVNAVPELFGNKHSSEYLWKNIFVFSRKKKVIQVRNNLSVHSVCKWWPNCSFNNRKNNCERLASLITISSSDHKLSSWISTVLPPASTHTCLHRVYTGHERCVDKLNGFCCLM